MFCAPECFRMKLNHYLMIEAFVAHDWRAVAGILVDNFNLEMPCKINLDSFPVLNNWKYEYREAELHMPDCYAYTWHCQEGYIVQGGDAVALPRLCIWYPGAARSAETIILAGK